MNNSNILVWLRNDLRLTDNKALYHACQQPHSHVHLIYIATPQQWQQHAMSHKQQQLIYQQLTLLANDAAQLALPLTVLSCDTYHDSIELVSDYCQQHKINALYFNRQYEFNEKQRDDSLISRLSTAAINIHCFDDSLLLAPGEVTTQQGEMYKVFTPFKRNFLKKLQLHDFKSLPKPPARADSPLKAATIPLFIKPDNQTYNDNAKNNSLFTPGEEHALKRLRQFCQQHIADYHHDRDYPAIEGTSQISAYLALGILSPRQCLNRLLIEVPDVFEHTEGGASTWLNELIWREFYRHLLVAYPNVCKNKPFVQWTEHIDWSPNNDNFIAWTQGKTGFPIVDAAMRQLNTTGWMHNRLRMITASFLVKDLLIDWRKGEHYFMNQLIDGDFAANNGGWQWAASTGTDSVPYFRIFNPTTQGKRFDADGSFIRQWLPELDKVPSRYIHSPHQWAEKNNQALDYPLPIVDHNSARLATIDAFERAKRFKSQ